MKIEKEKKKKVQSETGMNGNSNQSQKESTKGRIQGWKERGRVFQSFESVRPTNMPARKKKKEKRNSQGQKAAKRGIVRDEATNRKDLPSRRSTCRASCSRELPGSGHRHRS